MGPTHRREDVEVQLEEKGVRLRTPNDGVVLTDNEALELSGRLIDAAARAGGQDPEEQDWARVPMQYLRLMGEEHPDDLEEGAEPRTAEIHCWIRNQTRTNAMHVACGWLNNDDWYVTEVLEQRSVSRDDFADGEFLFYYEQALIDEEVFLYDIDGEDNQGENSDGE